MSYSTNLRLRELIRAIRNCKTAQEERSVIAKECAAIRNSFKEQGAYRARNVAKLMYIHMLGYPTHFGQMECITLISSPEYPEKRIGYLALMILLDEEQEVLPLIEHTLKKDLEDKNQFVQALALCTIANIANADMCLDLSPEVEKLFLNSPSYIRKKAALCAIRMIKKCPSELSENYIEKLDTVWTNEHHQRNHGILITCVALTLELCRVKDETLRKQYILHFRKYAPVFIKILKSLLMSTYALEHDIDGIADPFLQTSLLKLLRVLAKGSTQVSTLINDILAQVTTDIQGGKKAGNAILYECVKTILEIESEKTLRVSAINQLGKFLVNRDNNLRFVALYTLAKLADKDIASVYRHMNTIIDCLKDYDNSIRSRALDLIYMLMNKDNIKELTEELINLLQELSHTNRLRTVIDNGSEMLRQSLTTKLCSLVEKHAPVDDLESKRWKLETFLRIITISGQFVREEVSSIFIGLLTQNPELQKEFTLKLFIALEKFIPKPHLVINLDVLIQIAVWSIGEFGDLIVNEKVSGITALSSDRVHSPKVENNESDSSTLTITPEEILCMFERIMDIIPRSNTTSRSYILTAVAKFTAKYPELIGNDNNTSLSTGDILSIGNEQATKLTSTSNLNAISFFKKFSTDVNLELQQRACEFSKLLGLDYNLVSKNILDRMPVIETDRIVQMLLAGEVSQKKFTVKRKGDESDTDSEISIPDRNNIPSTSTPQGPQLIQFDEAIESNEKKEASGGLFDLDSLFTNLNTSANATASKTNELNLDDILSAPSLPPQEHVQPKATQDKYAGAKSIQVYSKNGVVIRMLTKQNDPINHPELHHVIIQFGNTNRDQTITGLSFLCAVPKYVKLQIFKANSEQLPPNSELGTVIQKMKLENTQHAQKPNVPIKYQIKYTLGNGQQIVDQGTTQL
jgi:AP-1 complex subunit gamma-1